MAAIHNNFDGLYWEERPDANKSCGLCVPQDSLDDLDFFPNFSDDFISITDLFSTLEEEDEKTQNKVTVSKYAEEAQKRKRAERRRRYSNQYSCGRKKRKCSHCESEETPQWRMGPMGPNTLCNACGVRYKSGRLVAEYRPAASPSFDSSKHSNFHRKIMQDKRVC